MRLPETRHKMVLHPEAGLIVRKHSLRMPTRFALRDEKEETRM